MLSKETVLKLLLINDFEKIKIYFAVNNIFNMSVPMRTIQWRGRGGGAEFIHLHKISPKSLNTYLRLYGVRHMVKEERD